jgi:putative ABC transport system permease protein
MPLLRRLALVFARKHDVDEELEFHLSRQIEINLKQGMSSEEARRQALIAFGGVQQTRETVVNQRGLPTVESIIQDLRYALRMMRKAPGFTFVAVSILAFGIGANTAIFSAVNTIVYARWSVPEQGRLMLIKEPSASNSGVLISVPNFEDYQRRQTTFQQLSLWVGKSVNLTGRERPERLIGAFVSANFFETLGVRAGTGRLFQAGEDKPGAAPVAVISYEAWQTRFGGDPHMLGRTLILNSQPFQVVGILPRGFSVPVADNEVFVTAQFLGAYSQDRNIRPFLIFGRLKAGVSREQATADLDTIAQGLAQSFPRENGGIHVEVTSLQDMSTQRVRAPLLVLLGAVMLVLLIVCANVANLLLARGATRQSEIAVRSALGAARGRLVRQFFSESLLLAIVGGGCGLLLAEGLLKLLVKIAPVDVDITATAVLDVRVLAFTATISIATGILFGIAPALQFSRANLSSALTSGSRLAGQSWRSWVRSGFVVFQVALSIALMVSAALLVKSFHALLLSNPGFVTDHLLSMEYRLPPSKYKTTASQLNFHRQMLARVQQIPGARAAAIVQGLPLSGNWGQNNFMLPGQPSADQKFGVTALTNAVTPEYFSTIGIPLLAGRLFNDHDDEGSPPAAIVSRTFADKYFPHQDPVGQQIQSAASSPINLAADHGSTNHAIIIGVVGSAKQLNVREELAPQVYFTYAQDTGTFGTLVIRTVADPISVTDDVRRAVWSVDKDQPVWRIRTMDSIIERDTAPDRFAMVLMTGLSILALVLSALGTYGMLSNMVTQRTRELGVRLALGAPPANLRRLVLAQGISLIALGTALGLGTAAVCARLIRSLLFGVAPGDLSAFALGLAAMVAFGMLASYLPARRATRVDPMVVLRYE